MGSFISKYIASPQMLKAEVDRVNDRCVSNAVRLVELKQEMLVQTSLLDDIIKKLDSVDPKTNRDKIKEFMMSKFNLSFVDDDVEEDAYDVLLSLILP